ncbi:MAG: DUF2079 domain-containing protein, partial [Tepidisphaeraceae bacterium]
AEICFVTWGMFFLWKWLARDGMIENTAPTPTLLPRPRTSAGVVWGILAGLTLGYACLIRHTAALLVLVVMTALAIRLVRGWKRGDVPWMALGALALSYSVFPVVLGAYNWRYFDNPLHTGYALTGEQLDMTGAQLLRNVPVLIRGLNHDLALLVFPLGLLGMLFLGRPRDRALKLLWFLPLFVVYAGYYYAPASNAYYRFLLPVVPLFVGSAMLLLHSLSTTRARRVLAMSAIAVVLVIHSHEYFTRALGARWPWDKDPNAPVITSNNAWAVGIASTARAASEALHDDAVIFAAEPMHDHVGTRKRFRLYAINAFTPDGGEVFRLDDDPRRRRRFGGPQPRIQPVRRERLHAIYQANNDDALQGRLRHIARDFIAAGRQVAVLIPPARVGQMQSRFGKEMTLAPLKQWDAPPRGAWGLYEVKPASVTSAPTTANAP